MSKAKKEKLAPRAGRRTSKPRKRKNGVGKPRGVPATWFNDLKDMAKRIKGYQ